MKAQTRYMEVTVKKEVLIEGFAELTDANCKLFRKQVCAALNGRTVVEIDLSRTTCMDCAGLGVDFSRQFSRPPERRSAPPQSTSAVQQLLDLVRAGLVFEIVNTRTGDQPIS